jgi:hypothetical protein
MTPSHFTIGQLAERFGAAAWQVRRAVDGLGIAVPRAGLYRLVPHDQLGAVERELVRRGYRTNRTAESAT